MIQIRAACKNKSCQFYGQVQTLNLPMVGLNIEAKPPLLCSGCRMQVATEFIDPTTEGVVIDGG